MSYTSTTDLLALLRTMPDGTVREASMPGVDWLLAALSRAGMVSLWVNPTAGPTVNQAVTVWFKTSASSWATEGTAYLWDAVSQSYLAATPALWSALFQAVAAQSVNEVDPSSGLVLTAQQSGTLFTNTNVPIVQYELPQAAAAPGATYEFLATVAGSLNVIVYHSGTPTADKLQWGATISTIGALANYFGSYLKIRSINGQWYVLASEGTWVLS